MNGGTANLFSIPEEAFVFSPPPPLSHLLSYWVGKGKGGSTQEKGSRKCLGSPTHHAFFFRVWGCLGFRGV